MPSLAAKQRDLVIGLALMLTLLALPAAADVKGQPTVIDGDSLELAGQRFDLFGIDSPEPGTLCRKENGEAFDCGRIATTALLDLTAGAEVTCAPKDKTQPTAAEAIPALCTAGGFSLNRNMVHTGWALADRALANDYVDTEEGAKAAKRGLWRWSWEVQPPWPSKPSKP